MLPNAAAKINEVFLKIPAIRVNSLADNALNFLFYPELYPGGRLLTKIHKLWPEPQLKESCKPAVAPPAGTPNASRRADLHNSARNSSRIISQSASICASSPGQTQFPTVNL
jgi:hypothetical protein